MNSNRIEGVGLIGMIAIVFGSMVGGGIFNIAQNMASAAGLGAVIISWLITGFGMVFLVLTFKILSDSRPDLNQGIYRYAQEGFGNYIGFNIAWGYWLCVAFGNVSFAIMLNDAVGAFFPVFLQHRWPSLIFCWGIVWGMFGLVINGVMTASFINTVMTILKFGAIVLIIVLLVIYAKLETLSSNMWEITSSTGVSSTTHLTSQIMSTMLVTMFCFVGVEGGVMLSSYARKKSDVGKASVIGFYSALIVYAMISILCFGVRSREELAGMHDPSVAYVLRSICGSWAYYFVLITVIVSLLSGFIAWTLLCAQTPFGAAEMHMLPTQFLKTNRHNVPYFGLCTSTIFMSLFIILVCTAPDVFMAALNLTTIMVLPAYAFSGAFLWKISIKEIGVKRIKYCFIGILCTLYCIWCIFAGGAPIFFASSILYVAGIYFYYVTWKQNCIRTGEHIRLMTKPEIFLCLILIICAIASVILISIGKITLS